jgi:hypothetical protein
MPNAVWHHRPSHAPKRLPVVRIQRPTPRLSPSNFLAPHSGLCAKAPSEGISLAGGIPRTSDHPCATQKPAVDVG